jgi:hypothetical protein
VSWYLRSFQDEDTHQSAWNGFSRTVYALCGAQFQPVPVAYGGYFLANPSPAQVCPDCARVSGVVR